MKFLKNIITTICLVSTFIVNAGEPPATKVIGVVNQPTNAELQLLQGTWVGHMVDTKPQDKITITITGDSLHFHRDTNFWFKTTFTLPAGRNPKELHATIKDSSSPKDSNGKVVVSFYKIENGKLTLAVIGEGADEEPKTFEAAEAEGGARYELQKILPHKKNLQPLQTK